MEFIQYPFMQRALVAGIIIAMVCPLIGIFLVLRRLSLIGDTLAHTSLVGVAVGVLSGFNVTIVALLTTILAALGIEKLRKNYKHYSELAIAIMMATGVSLAIFLISFYKGNMGNFSSFLFGSIVAVSPGDLMMIVLIGLMVIAVIYRFFHELFYITLDNDGAHLSGINVERINFIFILMIAITISIALRIVGVLLISSLMVLPVAAALKVAQSFRQASIYAIIYSVSSTVIGLIMSYYLDTAPGGTIILTSVILLLSTLMIKGLVNNRA
jgi:zinc transport system permease protein